MSADTASILSDLAAAARGCLARVAGRDADIAERFARDLAQLDRQARPMGRAGEVRALQFLPQVLAGGATKLSSAAAAAVGAVNWTEFYAPDAWSTPFLDGFANGEGIGPDGPLPSNHVILGLFILGPGRVYPAHAHPAEEFYLCVSGAATFTVGAAALRALAPGEIVFHRSNEAHQIETSDVPFFAIFAWRGDINGASWYREDMQDTRAEKRFPKIAKAPV